MSNRILPTAPFADLGAYAEVGGGMGLSTALSLGPSQILEVLAASGLRGRGGAGFPTARKWATVIDNRSASATTTVVVNAAEGEPGTFKDRALLRATPYAVLEGALIAAHAVGAARIVVGAKETSTVEIARLRNAIGEVRAAGWGDGVEMDVIAGPTQYLLGEETALLEVIDGRHPFPRVAPPFRRGVGEVGVDPVAPIGALDLNAANDVAMASSSVGSVTPPALVNNVETLANVAWLFREGVEQFRSIGTDASPGTIICTVTGAVRRPGVGEVPMGTPLGVAIDRITGGVEDERYIAAVLPGVSAAVLTVDLLDTPLTHEAMSAVGSGLGSGTFMVFDDTDDMLAVAAGVSRFLYVESCGQCTPCKGDGGAISRQLDRLLGDEVVTEEEREWVALEIGSRLGTVAEEARCALAGQHEAVLRSIIEAFPEVLRARAEASRPADRRFPIGPLVGFEDGLALVDEVAVRRQPDWSDGPVDSGQRPVERLGSTVTEPAESV